MDCYRFWFFASFLPVSPAYFPTNSLNTFSGFSSFSQWKSFGGMKTFRSGVICTRPEFKGKQKNSLKSSANPSVGKKLLDKERKGALKFFILLFACFCMHNLCCSRNEKIQQNFFVVLHRLQLISPGERIFVSSCASTKRGLYWNERGQSPLFRNKIYTSSWDYRPFDSLLMTLLPQTSFQRVVDESYHVFPTTKLHTKDNK